VKARSTRLILALAAVVALGGLGVATYLAVVHYAGQPIVCSAVGDCELVNSSDYAKLGPLPVALLGAIAYTAMLALVAVSWLRLDATALLAAWGIALASFVFSAYLTYIELFVLDAICVYCVASASLVSALFLLLSAAVWFQQPGGAARSDGLGEGRLGALHDV
jgi:uncharacterized membrane protein